MATTLEQFVESLSITGLMTATELQSVREGVAARKPPPDVETLAKELVKAGKLTKFQANAIYQGKAKGLVCGEYVLLEKIGAGGMGQVFKARHKRMNRIVAVKLLAPHTMVGDKQKALNRFHQEVETAARLVHPNIVIAYDAGEANGLHYLVMEHVEGQDLASALKPDKKLPLDQALGIVLQAARGLEYAHGQGIVHRDIKPSNLLMDRKGNVKILDMGLARVEDALTGADRAAGAGLTQDGEVMGTVDYMAPEQARNTRDADARADIYSLGCTLFRLATGHVVFEGQTMVDKILGHHEKPIPPLGKHCQGVSRRLEHAFERMLAKKPEERFQSMTEVIAELEACRADAPGEEHTPLVTDEPPVEHGMGSFLTKASGTGLSRKPSRASGSVGGALREPPQGDSEKPDDTAEPAKPAWTANRRVRVFGGGLAALLLIGAAIALWMRDKSEPAPVAQGDAAENGTSPEEPSVFSKGFASSASVEEFVAPAAANPPAGAVASVTPKPEPATPSAGPATQTAAGQPPALPPEGIDLLKLVDLKRDDLDGTWRAEGLALSCELPEGNAAGRLQLPYAPSAEYDLHVEAEMLNDESALTIVLVVGSSRVGFTIYPKIGVTGLGQLDGMHYNHKDNPTSVQSALRRPPGQPLAIVCQVRPTSVAIALDGRQVVDWKGDPQQLSVNSSNAGLDTTKLCAYGRYGVRLTNCELLPPGGQSRKIPPEGIDLLKLLDLKRDVDAGTWNLEGTILSTTAKSSHSLEFPFAPPAEYDLHIEMQTTRTGITSIGLVVGPTRVAFNVDPRLKRSGLGLIHGMSGTDSDNPTYVSNAFGLVAGRPMTIVCQVRPTSVRVTLAGRPVADWNGDPKDLSVKRGGDKTKLFVTAHGGDDGQGARFTRYELLPPDGVPQPKTVEVAAATAKSGVRVNLLRLIDVKRDVVRDANWKFDGAALIQAPSAQTKHDTLQIPFRAPAEYELRVVAEPLLPAKGVLRIGLVVGSSRAAFTVARNSKTSGLTAIQGKSYSENETTVLRLPGMEKKAPMTIICTVQGAGVRVMLNGQRVVDWRGDFKQLSTSGVENAPADKSTLFLTGQAGDATGSFRITKLELVPLGAQSEPVPSSVAVDEALAKVTELVGELPKTASAAQKADAARRMHEQASSADDGALRYALLTEAVKLATAADDFRLVLDLLEDLQRCFDADATSILNVSLNEIANRTRPPNDRKELIFKFLETGEAEIAAERYDSASLVVKTASQMIAKSAEADLKKEGRNRELEAEAGQKLFIAAEPARQTLRDNPNDYEANLAVGTYLAVARDDWPAALAHLAKGSDALVANAALAESREQQDPNRLANIGTLWLDAAEKADMPAKSVYLERSRKWLAQGASKLKPADLTKLTGRYKKVDAEARRLAGTAFVKRHPLRALSLGGHWYQFMPEQLAWHEARRRCEDLGGTLVCLETPAEAQAVYQYATAQYGKPGNFGFWTGATEEGHDRVFTWASGSSMQFTDWASGYPHSNVPGEAVYAWTDSTKPLKWYDGPPSEQKSFVCEWER